MKLPCKKNDVVFIAWHDACCETSRVHQDAIDEVGLVTNTNIGWIAHENERRIVLAHGVSTGGEIDHLAIPTASIISRVPLMPPSKRRSCGGPHP